MDICYPTGTNWGCALSQQKIDSLDPDLRERAESLAWTSLQSLTGFRLSICPTLVRPCSKRCMSSAMETAASSGYFSAYIMNGSWFNACGCSTDMCSCTTVSEIIMPTAVGAIVEVVQGGVTLPVTAYRMDNGNRLVRTDGGVWPVCQDMNQAYNGLNALSVRYYAGLAPNDNLRYAAGILAAEFYALCNGESCRLPDGVTNINRSGMSMELVTGLFANGQTGIKEVDAIIRVYNPNGLRTPPRAMSPDSMSGRIRTGSY